MIRVVLRSIAWVVVEQCRGEALVDDALDEFLVMLLAEAGTRFGGGGMDWC